MFITLMPGFTLSVSADTAPFEGESVTIDGGSSTYTVTVIGGTGSGEYAEGFDYGIFIEDSHQDPGYMMLRDSDTHIVQRPSEKTEKR